MNREPTPKRINSVSEIADGSIDNERDGHTEYASKRLLESLSEKEILRQDRTGIFAKFQEAYPDVRSEKDLAEKIIERFNWIEYQEKLDNE